jgi:hypothetical protein
MTRGNQMPKYEVSVKLFTTLIVTAENDEDAEKQAKVIADRMAITDPQNPDVVYDVDSEDGPSILEKLYDEDDAE